MHDQNYSDRFLADILRSSRMFAVVGASANPSRPSHFVSQYLIDKGYDVQPINPGLAGQQLFGRQVHASLGAASAPIDVVDIFRNSEAALAVTREAIRLKDELDIKTVWMQVGVINEIAAAEAEAAGLAVVMNRCPKIEYARLLGSPGI
jgi:predicted CoA-binding protein